jgi:hypothetical protein
MRLPRNPGRYRPSLDRLAGRRHPPRHDADAPFHASACTRDGSLHMSAAWDLDLFNAAAGEQRDRVCWCLVETASPYLVGRREPERELIQAGRSALGSLLQAYARCLKADSWPAFDVASENPSRSWSGVARELWMADVDSRSSAFFGVDASLALSTS